MIKKMLTQVIFLFCFILPAALYAANIADITTQLSGVSSTITSDADLATLGCVIGNATVVGLGEATHGTSEFFQMKHRLIKYLVEKKGFTIFAIESPMNLAAFLNDYVLYGKGDVNQLRTLLIPFWQTQEFVDMLIWMREYNQKAQNKIRFYGFDSQQNLTLLSSKTIKDAYQEIQDEQAINEIQGIVSEMLVLEKKWNSWATDSLSPYTYGEDKARNEYFSLVEKYKNSHLPKEELDELIKKAIAQRALTCTQLFNKYFAIAQSQQKEIQDMADTVNAKINKFIEKTKQNSAALIAKIGQEQYDWVLQNVRLLSQTVEIQKAIVTNPTWSSVMYFGVATRSRLMAENVFWIKAAHPNAKIMLWAHNGHINNSAYDVDEIGDPIENNNGQYRETGWHLKQALGKQYFPVGLATYQGTVNYGSGIGKLAIPPENSFEALVNNVGFLFAFIDLSNKQNLPIAFKNQIFLRMIGAASQYPLDQFILMNVGMGFDAMIYIKDSQATTIL